MNNSSAASRREPWLAVLLTLTVVLTTYGTQIPNLGFYRDDWYLLWGFESKGAQGLLSLFQGDRPFVGWLYTLDFSLAGVSPLAWHLYALGIKMVSALAMLWLLRSLWENRRIETFIVTLLFVVYPGFYQQPNALTYKQLLLAYAASLLSLALTVNAVKAQKITYKIIFSGLAVSLGAFYILIYEALVGMEAVRILLLWYLFLRRGKTWKENVRLTLMSAVPYLAFALSFVVWRVFFFDSTRKAVSAENMLGNLTNLHGLLTFLIETGKDLLETSFFAWTIPFQQYSTQMPYKELGLSLALALAVIAAAGGHSFFARKHAAASEEETPRDFLALGALIVFVTTLPVTASGRNAHFWGWDRYTYQSVLGVSLLMGGLAFYAFKGGLRWAFISALLVSGVVTQFGSAVYYRDYWRVEREAWWQLAWRAPQIEDGTTLIVALPGGFGLAEEYEVWGPVNLVYQPGGPLRLSGQVMFDDIWMELLARSQENRLVRNTFTVKRDYGRVVVLSQSAPYACLHALDGRRFDQAVTEARPDVRFIAKYSDVGLILPAEKGVVPPAEVFGAEPPHTWCYF
jgi:hypothetical protein